MYMRKLNEFIRETFVNPLSSDKDFYKMYHDMRKKKIIPTSTSLYSVDIEDSLTELQKNRIDTFFEDNEKLYKRSDLISSSKFRLDKLKEYKYLTITGSNMSICLAMIIAKQNPGKEIVVKEFYDETPLCSIKYDSCGKFNSTIVNK